MAVCNSCGKDARRIRTTFEVNGKPLPTPKDECEYCGNMDFDPAWLRQRPVMGWESKPHMYRRKEDPDGGYMYEATDELRADTEAQILKSQENSQLEEAIAEKRQTRRTTPLVGDELRTVLNRAHKIAAECVAAHNQMVRDDA